MCFIGVTFFLTRSSLILQHLMRARYSSQLQKTFVITYLGDKQIVSLRTSLHKPNEPGHINNLLNTCFWALVKSGKSPVEAQGMLNVPIYSFFLIF
jgi:hypothetical protein